MIGINICRNDPRKPEFISWSYTGGAFHTPSAFGHLFGVGPDLRPYRYEVTGMDLVGGKAKVSIRNRTGTDRDVAVEFVARSADGRELSAVTRAFLKKGAGAEISSELPLLGPGLYRLHARLRDETGKVRLVTQSVDMLIQEGISLDFEGTEFDFYTREPSARARCFIDATRQRCKRMKLLWRVEGEGKSISGSISLTPGFNEWSIPINELPFGVHKVHLTLKENGKTVQRFRGFRKLPPAENEVRVNQWGRFLVVNGKPFLWYGFYTNMFKKGTPDSRWLEVLKDMKSANATTVLAYTLWDIEEHERIGWALDRADEIGLKVWVHLQWIFSFRNPKFALHTHRYRSEEEAVSMLRKVIGSHKNHPALLGWCTLDEPGNRPQAFTREFAEKFYRLVKELDPYHPCIFSHLTQERDVGLYNGATDIALIPFAGGKDTRYDRLFYAFWETGLPLATNTPCYGAISSPREPTAKEIRVRIYKPLILGARGFCSYTYRCASMVTWREFARIGRELQTLAPVLLTPNQRLRVEVSPRGGGVFALLKRQGEAYYLIAVNVLPETVYAFFRLIDVPRIRSVSPILESMVPYVDREAKRLSVTMEPRSTLFYRILP